VFARGSLGIFHRRVLHHTKSGGDSPEKRDCPDFEAGKKGYKKNHPDQRVIMMKRFYSQKKILVLG
jgi:hypothetical protein